MCKIFHDNSDSQFHLRVTVKESDALKLAKDFVAKFTPDAYIFSFEQVGTDNQHIHAHLLYNEVPKKQTLSDWFGKIGYAGKYYHKNIKTEPINNILYCVKELKILYHNVCNQHLDQIIDKTEKINEDKKKQARDKLADLFIDHLKNITNVVTELDPSNKEHKEIVDYHLSTVDTPAYVCKWIHNQYTNEWNKTPPVTQMKAIALYIMEKATKQTAFSYRKYIDEFYNQMFKF